MQKYLVPKEGLLVRDPVSFNPLPVKGIFVDWDGKAGRFWRRRVRCGDVSIIKGKKLDALLKEFADEKEALRKELEKEEETAEPLQPKRKQRGSK